MARPSKSIDSAKGHRTQQEKAQRKKAEEQAFSGRKMKAFEETKKNPIALKEFKRVQELFKAVGKNDAVYEAVINRYCILTAECEELLERKRTYATLITEIKEQIDELKENQRLEPAMFLRLIKEINATQVNINKIDSILNQKRKMMFDIEKENSMTVAAALRSIPKKVDESENPLLAALKEL